MDYVIFDGKIYNTRYVKTVFFGKEYCGITIANTHSREYNDQTHQSPIESETCKSLLKRFLKY